MGGHTQTQDEKFTEQLAELGPYEIEEQVFLLPNDGSVECELHDYHSPEVTTFDRHHIHLKSEGGSDDDENFAVLCPTGHRNVHALLRLFRKLGPENVARPSWGHATWEMAMAGYEAGKKH